MRGVLIGARGDHRRTQLLFEDFADAAATSTNFGGERFGTGQIAAADPNPVNVRVRGEPLCAKAGESACTKKTNAK